MPAPKLYGRTIPFGPYTPEDLVKARRRFPEEKLASRALEKFARANWEGSSSNRWFWKDNCRYTCGDDIIYNQIWVPRTKEVRCPFDYKKYLVPLGGPPTLSQIDIPKPQRLSKLLAHKSEKQWGLPRDHPRHLLNFPQEILDAIFGFTLSTQEYTILPDVSTSNKVHKYEDSKLHQTYKLGRRAYDAALPNTPQVESLVISTVIHQQRYDAQGKYFVLRRVCRHLIDATILRVCKSICDQGTKLLYAGNEFEFKTTKTGKLGASASLFDGILYPNSLSNRSFCQGRDEPQATELRRRMAGDAINIIENRTPVLDLDFDMYHDLFVRFLCVIGPSKAAMIKTLHFIGPVKSHYCSQDSSCTKLVKWCKDDLIESLLLYITLIKRFCTNLQKLVIVMTKDYETSDNLWGSRTVYDFDERERECYARLQALLENQIREFDTVQDLQVYEDDRLEVECAKETEAWFSERTRQRGLEALAKAKLQSRMQDLTVGDDDATSYVETFV
ncbi:uncharacterized protein Bfra_009706 [Botrytis fragariae]|uniref:F-box domain-containing protein n=1 Tax=Botrytis fragariae TaxID=1964551 RepID=A0A8H6AMK1_9HELO|nr:uncharacterized protein Bfra_009706 [Botrytis fragariae]KAF5870322.1 hypothetical protein Bfra_009706 [Botrytis fragariae]